MHTSSEQKNSLKLLEEELIKTGLKVNLIFTLVLALHSECGLFVKNQVQQIFTVLKNEFFYQSFSNFHCSFNLTSNFFKVDRIPGVQLQIVENNQNHG